MYKFVFEMDNIYISDKESNKHNRKKAVLGPQQRGDKIKTKPKTTNQATTTVCTNDCAGQVRHSASENK